MAIYNIKNAEMLASTLESSEIHAGIRVLIIRLDGSTAFGEVNLRALAQRFPDVRHATFVNCWVTPDHANVFAHEWAGLKSIAILGGSDCTLTNVCFGIHMRGAATDGGVQKDVHLIVMLGHLAHAPVHAEKNGNIVKEVLLESVSRLTLVMELSAAPGRYCSNHRGPAPACCERAKLLEAFCSAETEEVRAAFPPVDVCVMSLHRAPNVYGYLDGSAYGA